VRSAPGSARLGGSLAAAVALHATAAAALFLSRPARHAAQPPIYRVDIVAAPPGPRAIGAVTPATAPSTPAAPVPTRAESKAPAPAAPSKAVPPARRAPVAATPVPPVKQAPTNATPPRAGGGPTGGRGADVANIRTQGIEFPYPAYLNNIVRRIATEFSPPNPSSPLRAEVRFLIHRDGSVSDITVVSGSGVYAFDLIAKGAVEAAARAFGPLPSGFPDDVLPVVFSFDPSLSR
jgi:protein TonB